MTELPTSGTQETPVTGGPHHDLGDAQRDNLRIAQTASPVAPNRRQQVVGRAVDTDQEQVEVP